MLRTQAILSSKTWVDAASSRTCPFSSLPRLVIEQSNLTTHFTYDSLTKGASNVDSISEGKQLHALLIVTGLHQNVFFATKLVRMYAMLGKIEDARLIFDGNSERNVFIWNAMIRGYARKGFFQETFSLYNEMQKTGILPDKFTLACVLRSCAEALDYQKGRDIHDEIIRCGYEVDAHLGSALMSMYGKCGSLEDARKLFDRMSQRDLVSRNVMIAVYAQNGFSFQALDVLRHMGFSGIKADEYSLASLIPVCSDLGAIKHGKEIHGYAIRNRLNTNSHVISALVSLYSKCGTLDYAQHVFEKIWHRDLASWTAIIVGCSQAGQWGAALEYFKELLREGLRPDTVTISSILPACTHLGALRQGKEIHSHVIRCGQGTDVVICSALIIMYGKCGNVGIAGQVFRGMPLRNMVSWNAMITGYGMHGHAEEAFSLFYEMQKEGMQPDHITFFAILCACAQASLADQGLKYFNTMSRDYGITAKMEHYVQMVNLIGYGGFLDDAFNLIIKMPLQPHWGVWKAFFGACKFHGTFELRQYVAQQIFELYPDNVAYNIMPSYMGRWHDTSQMQKTIRERELSNGPGCSWIEINDRVYTFFIADRSHPQLEEINAFLQIITNEIRQAGYLSDTTSELLNRDEKEKWSCGHSELFAISFGLLNTCPGTRILINKNLHVCNDCHNFTKSIAKYVGREIILQDMTSSHYFKDGFCSCGD